MSSDWPVPGYRYVAPLEQGRAIHHAETVLGSPVVVKVFTEPGDDRAATYVGLSGEPGWPGILASGTLPTGATFVIMPRFEFTPLRYGTPELARRAVRQVAGAVDALHRRGRVHGDIRAGNVMVTGDGSLQVLLVGLTHGRDDQAGDVHALAELARAVLAGAGEAPEALASMSAARSAADVFAAAGATGAGGGDNTTMVVADGPQGWFNSPDDTVVVSDDLFDAFTQDDTVGVPDGAFAAPALDPTVVVTEELFEGGDTVVVDEDLFPDDDTVVVSEDLFDPAPADPLIPALRHEEDVTVADGVDHGLRSALGPDDPRGATPEGWLRPGLTPMSPFPGVPPERAPLPAPPIPAPSVRSFQAPPPPLGDGSASGDLVRRVAAEESATQFPVWFLALCALGLLVAIAALLLAVTA